MGAGRSDIENALEVEVGAVLGGFHSQDRTLYVMERLCPGPQGQHKPLHVPGVAIQLCPEISPTLPRVVYSFSSTPLCGDNNVGCHVGRAHTVHF